MTKRQLIDEIVAINPSASPRFLAHFEDEDLGDYLAHLRVLSTPRLSGDARRFDKYFHNVPKIPYTRPPWRSGTEHTEEVTAAATAETAAEATGEATGVPLPADWPAPAPATVPADEDQPSLAEAPAERGAADLAGSELGVGPDERQQLLADLDDLDGEELFETDDGDDGDPPDAPLPEEISIPALSAAAADAPAGEDAAGNVDDGFLARADEYLPDVAQEPEDALLPRVRDRLEEPEDMIDLLPAGNGARVPWDEVAAVADSPDNAEAALVEETAAADVDHGLGAAQTEDVAEAAAPAAPAEALGHSQAAPPPPEPAVSAETARTAEPADGGMATGPAETADTAETEKLEPVLAGKGASTAGPHFAEKADDSESWLY